MVINQMVPKGIDDALVHGAAIHLSELSNATSDQDSWPELKDLPSDVKKAPALPPELIPEPIRAWVVDSAERLGVPLEYIAVPAISAAAICIGRRIGVTPKQFDTNWLVVASGLWCALIGSPGSKKTPAISEATRPLTIIEGRYRDKYQEDMKATDHERLVLSAKIAGLKKRIESQSGKKPTKDFETQLAEQTDRLREITPQRKRLTTQDATIEKFGELLSENPHGMGVLLDELTGWIRGLERSGHEAARAFYLKGWNGTLSDLVERITRGSTYIEGLYVVVLGGIQPDVFDAFLAEVKCGGYAADGLFQRFQMAVVPDAAAMHHGVDRTPNELAFRRALEIYERLTQIDANALGAKQNSRPNVLSLQFDSSAQIVFNEFLKNLESRLRSGEQSGFEAHLAKYRSTMPALALVFH